MVFEKENDIKNKNQEVQEEEGDTPGSREARERGR